MTLENWPRLARLHERLSAIPHGYLLGALALLLLAQVNPWWYPTPDACSYYSIARNLAREHMLENLGRPQLWYAPGYSILISPLFLLADHPFLPLALAQAVFGIIFMLGVYVWSRRLGRNAAVLITALSVVNVLVLHLVRRTLSEMAFMAVMIWAVNAIHCVLEAKERRSLVLRTLLAAGLVALSALIRPAGIVLVAGLGIVLLLQARRRLGSWSRAIGLTIAVGAPAALVILAFMAHEALAVAGGGGRTYLDNFADRELAWYERHAEGLRISLTDIGRVALPGMYKSYGPEYQWDNVNTLIYVGFCGLLGVGWSKWVREQRDVLAWAFPFYIALHALYAMDSGGRFFVPMLPPVLACLWMLLQRLGEWRFPLFRVLLGLHLAAACIQWLAIDLPRARRIHADWPALREIAAAIGSSDPLPLVAEVPASAVHQLQILLDRSLPKPEEALAPTSETQSIITTAEQEPPAGFMTRTRAGRYQLLTREHQPTAPTERVVRSW